MRPRIYRVAAVMALMAATLTGCRNHNRDIIASACDELNSPAVMQQMLAVPGISGVSSTFDGDSLCMDIRLAERAELPTLDPEMLGLMLVEQYRQSGSPELADALKAENVTLIVHIAAHDGTPVTRVAVSPSQL